VAQPHNNVFANLPGGDWGTFMPDQTDSLDKDCETAFDLKQLVIEELSGEIELDDKSVDGLVLGIVSLLRAP
jgi:hypothetical protein